MTRLGDYQLQTQIGAGSSGTVWRAQLDGPVPQVVAVKRLRGPAPSPDEIVRLRREATVLRDLDHPHIVRMIAVLPDGDGLAICMQFASGGSLEALLAGRGPLRPGEVVAVAAPIADALASAHRRDIFHVDVKPANILFTSDGEPLLGDFGVARTLGRLTAVLGGETATAGTAHYLAPELLDGGDPDPRSDVYSLGVVCYEALTGKRPYDAALPLAVLRAADVGRYEPLSERPDIPPPLVRVVEQAMARDPDHRPATATQFAAALRATIPLADVRLPGPAAPEATAAPPAPDEPVLGTLHIPPPPPPPPTTAPPPRPATPPPPPPPPAGTAAPAPGPPAGPAPTAPDPTDAAGPVPAGPEDGPPQPTGPASVDLPEPVGPGPAGPMSAGPEAPWPQPAGRQLAGPEATRPEPAGPRSAGPEAAQPEPGRPQSAGPEAAGRDLAEPAVAGSEPARPEPAGPKPAGPEAARPEAARPGHVGPEGPRLEGARPEGAGAGAWRGAEGELPGAGLAAVARGRAAAIPVTRGPQADDVGTDDGIPVDGTRTFGPRPPRAVPATPKDRRVGLWVAVGAMAASFAGLAFWVTRPGPPDDDCADEPWPSSDPSVQVVEGDPEGDGCPTYGTYRMPAGAETLNDMLLTITVEDEDRQIRLGELGDSLFLGDWDCDGTDTPGLYRWRDGEVEYFNHWPEVENEPYEPEDGGRVERRSEARLVEGEGDDCDTIVVPE